MFCSIALASTLREPPFSSAFCYLLLTVSQGSIISLKLGKYSLLSLMNFSKRNNVGFWIDAKIMKCTLQIVALFLENSLVLKAQRKWLKESMFNRIRCTTSCGLDPISDECRSERMDFVSVRVSQAWYDVFFYNFSGVHSQYLNGMGTSSLIVFPDPSVKQWVHSRENTCRR